MLKNCQRGFGLTFLLPTFWLRGYSIYVLAVRTYGRALAIRIPYGAVAQVVSSMTPFSRVCSKYVLQTTVLFEKLFS